MDLGPRPPVYDFITVTETTAKWMARISPYWYGAGTNVEEVSCRLPGAYMSAHRRIRSLLEFDGKLPTLPRDHGKYDDRVPFYSSRENPHPDLIRAIAHSTAQPSWFTRFARQAAIDVYDAVKAAGGRGETAWGLFEIDDDGVLYVTDFPPPPPSWAKGTERVVVQPNRISFTLTYRTLYRICSLSNRYLDREEVTASMTHVFRTVEAGQRPDDGSAVTLCDAEGKASAHLLKKMREALSLPEAQHADYLLRRAFKEVYEGRERSGPCKLPYLDLFVEDGLLRAKGYDRAVPLPEMPRDPREDQDLSSFTPKEFDDYIKWSKPYPGL